MTARRRRAKPPTYSVRPSRRADTEVLVRHRQGMWKDIGIHTPDEIRKAGPRYRWWLGRESRARRFFGFVAVGTKGEVVGSGAVWLQPSQPRPGALARLEMPYIMSMYTEPAFRRRGVGTLLVAEMIRWARRRGFARITLHASAQGRPIYRDLGFEGSNEMRLSLVGGTSSPPRAKTAPGRRRRRV
ncbi:MAG TPA: GNAT family N-acetyltransferase [Thermoplasmata archaeon]|nr:GNAT family N-acetyltransferase [Thermoplasmata archaeon]